jgi:hypothetical protein
MIAVGLLIFAGYLLYQRYFLVAVIFDNRVLGFTELWATVAISLLSAIFLLILSSLLSVLHQILNYLTKISFKGSGIPAQLDQIQSQLQEMRSQQKQLIDQMVTLNYLTHQTYEMNHIYLKKIEQSDPAEK